MQKIKRKLKIGLLTSGLLAGVSLCALMHSADKKYMDETFAKYLDANVTIIDPIQGPDYGAYLYAKELG